MAKNAFAISNRVLIEALTADKTYTELDCGKVFTNRGAAGEVQITLPDAELKFDGHNFKMVVQTAQNFKVATATNDTLISRDDATADSILSTQIGNEIHVFCDGSSWYAYGSTDGGSYTIAT